MQRRNPNLAQILIVDRSPRNDLEGWRTANEDSTSEHRIRQIIRKTLCVLWKELKSKRCALREAHYTVEWPFLLYCRIDEFICFFDCVFVLRVESTGPAIETVVGAFEQSFNSKTWTRLNLAVDEVECCTIVFSQFVADRLCRLGVSWVSNSRCLSWVYQAVIWISVCMISLQICIVFRGKNELRNLCLLHASTEIAILACSFGICSKWLKINDF